MRHRAEYSAVLVCVSLLLAGLVLTASAQMDAGPIEPGAGEWRTWVLASAERGAEVTEVKNVKHTPVTNGKASYWQYGQYGGPGLIYRLSDEIGHLFPHEAARYQGWAQEFGESRIWAGIHFRSDAEAGWELGRHVGGVVIERARRDGAE